MKANTMLKTRLILFQMIMLIAAGPVLAQANDDGVMVRGGAVFFDRPEFDSVVLVEFPFTLSRHEFEFYRPDTAAGTYFTRIFAQITLYGVDGLPLDSANTYFSAAVSDSADAYQPDYTLFNSLVLVIRPGIYSAHLTVIDAVSKKEGRFFYDRIVVEPPAKNALAMGAKCLAYDIKYVGDEPAAAGVGVPKNGYEVRINPLGTFAVTDTVAFFYAELYNLDYQADQPSDYSLSYAALDMSGTVVHPLGTQVRPKPGRSAVIVETFDITGWSPGGYLLQVTASDPIKRHEVTYEIPIRIIAPMATPSELAASIGQDQTDLFDLETQLRLVRYLLTPDEEATLKRLTKAGQPAFLEQYWQEHDSDPYTEINENLLEMYERYLFANSFFSIGEEANDGWSTDRGRIFMTYGQCDDLDDQQHPVNRYPFQIWRYYSIDNGALFVFVDEDGFGFYKLVHSTVDREIFSKYWDEALKTGSLSFE